MILSSCIHQKMCLTVWCGAALLLLPMTQLAAQETPLRRGLVKTSACLALVTSAMIISPLKLPSNQWQPKVTQTSHKL